MDVHSRSRHGQAGVRRRRAACSQGRCSRRMVFADATVSAETARSGAHSYKEEDMVTAEDTNADHAKACQELWREERRISQRRARSRHGFSTKTARRRRARFNSPAARAASTGAAPRRSESGYIFVQTHDMSLMGWIEKKKPGRNYGRGTEGSTQPYDRASVDRPGPVFTVQRAGEGRERQSGRQLALPETALGAADRRQREHGRHRLADARSGSTGRVAGGQTEHRDGGSAGPIARPGAWCSSAPPTIIASAPSIRRRARSCGSIKLATTATRTR